MLKSLRLLALAATHLASLAVGGKTLAAPLTRVRGTLRARASAVAVALIAALGFIVAVVSTAQAATTTETLTAPFEGGPSTVTSQNVYTGTVSLTVSGAGQGAGTQCSDAFYVYTAG